MTLVADATIFLIAAVIAVPLFKKLGLGAVLGYLAAGVVLGPHALGLVGEVESILSFSKIGVVLLLFLVGLELAPARLWALRRNIMGLGSVQVMACALPIAGVALALGLGVAGTVVVALGLAFSSTALALQALSERGELSAAHGRAAFAILLFKYLALLPLMAAIPLMGEPTASLAAGELAMGILRTVAVLVAVIVGGHFLLRPVFRAVAAFGATETFTATALAVVLGTAVIVNLAGLPAPIGAFLAGVLLADSEYRQEIQASIEPFKGLLLGLFFMAVGMTADLGLLGEVPGEILGLTLALVVVKLGVTYGVGRWAGLPNLAATRLAALLPQGGELAFVLFSLAATYGVLGRATVDVLVAVVTLSMAATPLIMAFNERFILPRLRSDEPAPDSPAADPAGTEETPDVIIAGFGRYGQMLGRLLHSAHIRFTALEANVTQVDFVRRFGHRIYFGNAAKPEVLRAAGAGQAKAVVVAVNNVQASLAIVDAVRKQYPNMPIYALARTRKHAWQLQARRVHALAREVAATSMELGEQILAGFGWDAEEAHAAVQQFREHDDRVMIEQYGMYSRYRNLAPAAEEVAHELENLFEYDLEEPLEPEPGQAGTGTGRGGAPGSGWRAWLPDWRAWLRPFKPKRPSA